MQKVQPFLWFDTQAEEAANFYTSVFKNSKILGVHKYPQNAPPPAKAGAVMTVAFEINGLQFVALNGGPNFKFTEAISFLVSTETQEEIDELWEKLGSDGGEPGVCGWLKDKYGVSWQIAPPVLAKVLSGDPVKASKVMKEMMGMTKLNISELQAAYDGA
jgi:predicted 3-demethylubiquinone-9 3-methyltransferase (glyoxalase superfamily)